MSEVKRKLSSRKLWVAISTIVSGVLMMFGFAESNIEVISGAVLVLGGSFAYIYGESKIDAARIKEAVNAVVDIFEAVSKEVDVS